ncbi:MAG: AAA family ATPase [Aeromicrobium sp.]
MSLEITLLGSPRVMRDGVLVAFETRKAMALLAHLVMVEHPRPREALCELLYPGHDPDRARGALRRTLSTLRTGIGAEWLDTEHDRISLRRGPGLAVDVERFRTLAADKASPQSLEDAVALFAGGFLEGFSLRDSAEFDDWQLDVAAVLERELASALGRLVAHLVGRQDFGQAIPSARRWLGLDPLHEPAQRELIRLYAWNGDRAAAIEQYRSCVRTLSEELGVAPLAETAALFEQISDGTVAPPARREDPLKRPRPTRREAPSELPFVGRVRELPALFDAYVGARSNGGLAVIEGEAGIGKTRLADELVKRVRGSGGVVLAARCHDDEVGLPYGPVVELLREAMRIVEPDDWAQRVPGRHLVDASLLLPGLADLRAGLPDPLPFDGPGAQVRLFEAIASVISSACQGAEPAVVLLDDAHAADEATLDAITYLGRRLEGRSILLVLNWRSEAVPPGHRLRRLAVDLARAGNATILSPARLDESEVAHLVRSAHSDGKGPEFERRVFLESEGLPLFVAEYLAAIPAGGGAAGGTLTMELQGLFDRRLEGLGEATSQVLGAAAAIGRSFDIDILRNASGRSDEESVTALEELVARGVIRESSSSESVYDFSHSKLRELVYDRTGLARRRLLHGRIAAVIGGAHRGGQTAGLVAAHLRLAGDQMGAAEQHRLAAEQAVSVNAHADALEHLEAALALGYPDAAAAHERIGDLRTLLGDYGGAIASYETATAYCEPDARAAIEHKSGNVSHRRGEWDRAESRFTSALDSAPIDAIGLRARIQVDLSLTLHHAGQFERAAVLAREALALAQTADDPRAQAQAHNMLGVIARSHGDPKGALEHLKRSLELALELSDGPAEAAALNNLALVERDAHAIPTALELTERALTICANYGDRHREAALENNLADLHHAAGNETASMAHLKRAVAIFSEVGADEATRLPEIWKLVSW